MQLFENQKGQKWKPDLESPWRRLSLCIRDVGGAVKWRTAPHRTADPPEPHRRHFQKSRTAPHRTARKNFQTLNYKEKIFLKCSNRL